MSPDSSRSLAATVSASLSTLVLYVIRDWGSVPAYNRASVLQIAFAHVAISITPWVGTWLSTFFSAENTTHLTALLLRRQARARLDGQQYSDWDPRATSFMANCPLYISVPCDIDAASCGELDVGFRKIVSLEEVNRWGPAVELSPAVNDHEWGRLFPDYQTANGADLPDIDADRHRTSLAHTIGNIATCSCNNRILARVQGIDDREALMTTGLTPSYDALDNFLRFKSRSEVLAMAAIALWYFGWSVVACGGVFTSMSPLEAIIAFHSLLAMANTPLQFYTPCLQYQRRPLVLRITQQQLSVWLRTPRLYYPDDSDLFRQLHLPYPTRFWMHYIYLQYWLLGFILPCLASLYYGAHFLRAAHQSTASASSAFLFPIAVAGCYLLNPKNPGHRQGQAYSALLLTVGYYSSLMFALIATFSLWDMFST